MSRHPDDTIHPSPPDVRPAGVARRSGAGARGDPAPQDPTLCACTASSLRSSVGDIIVLRVAGEIDLGSDTVLRAAVDAALDQQPAHLVVDLTELVFCSARGMSILAAAAATAAAHGTDYAVSGTPDRIARLWAMLWPAEQLPVQLPTTTAGIHAALDHQTGADRTRARARARHNTRRGWLNVAGHDTHDQTLSTHRAVTAHPTLTPPPTASTPPTARTSPAANTPAAAITPQAVTAGPGPVRCPG